MITVVPSHRVDHCFAAILVCDTEHLAEDVLPVDLDDVIRALKIVKTNIKSLNAAKISSQRRIIILTG